MAHTLSQTTGGYMSDPAYSLELAIRADEKAKSAHDRLDRMNGSIDRLTSQVAATNGKIDTLATAIARNNGVEEGEEKARKSFLDSRRFWISTCVLLIGAIATLAYFAFGSS